MIICPNCGKEFIKVTPKQLVNYLRKINSLLEQTLDFEKMAVITQSLFCEGCGNFNLTVDHTK